MSIHLKRIVFFFCILCFGLGCCLGNRTNAGDVPPKEYKQYMGGIYKDFLPLATREISGIVTDGPLTNGIGLGGVVIFDKTVQMAVTDIYGHYKFKGTALGYTLIPQKFGYKFFPQSFPIPINSDNQVNINFEAQKLAIVTISGNVNWKNIQNSNQLKAAMLAHAEDGSLFYSIFTDVDGNYSIPVPFGWTGWVEPVSPGFEFYPKQRDYSGLKENKIREDYFVCAGANDSIVGKWDLYDYGAGYRGAEVEIMARTTGLCDYVGKVTKQGYLWKERKMEIGDEVWWLEKQSAVYYLGTQLVKGTDGIMPLAVWIKGNNLTDSFGWNIATKVP